MIYALEACASSLIDLNLSLQMKAGFRFRPQGSYRIVHFSIVVFKLSVQAAEHGFQF